MKKIFSALISVILILTMATSVFALGEPYFDAMEKMNGSFEAQMEVYMTVDKPFEILDIFAESMKNDMSAYEMFGMPSNLKTMIESVFDTTSKMDVKVSVSKDYKRIVMEMAGNTVLPLKFGENFKTTSEMSQKMWLELDFTDGNKPVYRTIQLNPFMGDKYIVTDMTEMLGEDIAPMAEIMSTFLSKENIEDIRTRSIEIIKNNAKITGSGSSYKLYFDDSAAKAYIGQIFEIVLDILNDMNLGENETVMPEKSEIEEALKPLSEINIFGKDGITYDVTLKNGNVYRENMKVSIDTNLYDILKAIDPEVLEDEELFITKENSKIAFSVYTNVFYKSVNNNPTITFPKLTEDNSIDMARAIIATPETDMAELEAIEHPRYFNVVSESYPIEIDKTAYIPVRNLFSAYDIVDEDIVWDEGIITIKSNGACEYFDEISFACQSTEVIKDGVKIPLEKQIVNYSGKAYVSSEFIEKVLGGRLSSIYFYATEYNWEERITEYLIVHESEKEAVS